MAHRRPSGPPGSSEPGDPGEIAAWVVADVVSDAVEAGRLEGVGPSLWPGVFSGGTQLTGDAEAVGGSRREIGHTHLDCEGCGEQAAARQEVLGEDRQAAGHFQQGGERFFGQVARAVRYGEVEATRAVGGEPPRRAPDTVHPVQSRACGDDPSREPGEVFWRCGQWLKRAAVRSAAAARTPATVGSPSTAAGVRPSSSSWPVANHVATV